MDVSDQQILHSFRFYCLVWLTYLVSLTLLCGCGTSGPERAVVSGTVTYEGRPVKKGRIAFFPLEGTQGAPSFAKILNGQYRLKEKGGVPVGTHRVEIYAQRVAAHYYAVPESQRAQLFDQGPPIESYLPGKYNKHSELKVTIDPGKREINQDFFL